MFVHFIRPISRTKKSPVSTIPHEKGRRCGVGDGGGGGGLWRGGGGAAWKSYSSDLIDGLWEWEIQITSTG